MKPGYKSTEFWLSLLATLVGAVMASGVIESGGVWDKVIGLVVTVLGALGYTASRALVKSTAVKADALLAAPKNS